jgi:hypothetical protein
MPGFEVVLVFWNRTLINGTLQENLKLIRKMGTFSGKDFS